MENWSSTEVFPWIQNQDPKKLIAFGIGMILITGKLARILTYFFPDFPKFSLLLSGAAVLLAWIQNLDPKKLIAFGIGMILIAGKLAKILTDFFPDFPKLSLLLSGTAFLLGFRASENSLDNIILINEGDFITCKICFQPWSNTGTHRMSSLKCGHFFGLSCVSSHLNRRGGKYCPTCNEKATKRDIRHHFVAQLV